MDMRCSFGQSGYFDARALSSRAMSKQNPSPNASTTAQASTDLPFAGAWADLRPHLKGHADTSDWDEPLTPNSRRLAFIDPEFLLRAETRGIRFQLELLKSELGLRAAGIQGTVAVFGSARCVAPEVAQQQLDAARNNGGDAIAQAERAVRTARYYAAAREFACIAARHGLTQPEAERLTICTGGGPGIMEAANRGAHDAGAPSVGLGIALPREQRFNPYVSPQLAFEFHYFALRKTHFMLRARALAVFPGGFGTLDELFSALALVQSGKVRPMPIVLFGSDYWRPLLDLDLLVEEGTIAPQDLHLITYADTPQAAWDAIVQFHGRGADDK
jgi:uncharacterized protein (TIGR00730 family)